jgi:hypothetical protein
MSRSRQARTDAFYRLPETCPKVRVEIHEAIEGTLRGNDIPIDSADLTHLLRDLVDGAFCAAVEHGTDKLRAALIECEEERLGEVARADDAETQRDRLTRDLEDARDEIKALRERVDELEAEISKLT